MSVLAATTSTITRITGEKRKIEKEDVNEDVSATWVVDAVNDVFNQFLEYIEQQINNDMAKVYKEDRAAIDISSLTDGTIFKNLNLQHINIDFIKEFGLYNSDGQDHVGKSFMCTDSKYQFSWHHISNSDSVCLLKNTDAARYLSMLMSSDATTLKMFKNHVVCSVSTTCFRICINLAFLKDFYRRRRAPMKVVQPSHSSWYSKISKLPPYINHCGWFFQFYSMRFGHGWKKSIQEHNSFVLNCTFGKPTINCGNVISISWENRRDIMEFKDGELSVSRESFDVKGHADFMDETTMLALFRQHVMNSCEGNCFFKTEVDSNFSDPSNHVLSILIYFPGDDPWSMSDDSDDDSDESSSNNHDSSDEN